MPKSRNPEVERVRKLHRSLINFALFVLEELEATEDWDADMLDRIGDEAKHRGLAYHDDEWKFQRSLEVRS